MKESELKQFIEFKNSWNTLPFQEKMEIAVKSDYLTNKGVDFFEQGDIEMAIYYFELVLKVMPINDDALKNLRACYRLKKLQDKLDNTIEKLRILGIQ